jgi:uncharacterized protein (TIGR03663 family)
MANTSRPARQTHAYSRPLFTTIAAVLLFSIAGLGLRLPRLSERPMHNDEAVNAIKFGQLLETGDYKYDPEEYHGPTLHYATLALAKLTGAKDLAHFTETRLRLVTVLFGVGLILLLPLVVDGLGRRGTIWAAVLTAVSPAFVFYSRYYIHEMLLVFFAFLTLAAGWRYWRSRNLYWALLAGAGLGLMNATKETFIITVAAAAGALVMNQVWNRFLDASGPPAPAPRINVSHLLGALAVWLLVAFTLFSSFFSNPNGPMDSIRTYSRWFHRAGGASEHMQPWYFYFQRLLWFHVAKGPIWTEALLLILAIVGGATGFFRKNLGRANASFVRFLTLFTLLLAAAYTVIGYKTPWCLLSFWHGTILLAGLGAAVILRNLKQLQRKIAAGVLLSLGVAHLGWQAVQASIPYAADQRNPYIYAQTSRDITRLVAQVKALAAASREGSQMLIKVMSPEGDYWPLPWYLRDFKNAGWWDRIPNDPFAPVMIVSTKFNAQLDDKKTHLMVGIFELRPQVFLELYVGLDLWRAYLAVKPPEPEK